MTIHTHTRHAETPEQGQTIEVAPGIHWLRFPLPFALDHINLWLLDGPDGWTIVDSGFNQPEIISNWEGIFDALLHQKPVEKIFITHFHPDHFGLTGWLAQKTDAPVFITPGEWQMVQALTDPDSADRLEQIYRPYYQNAGVPADVLEALIDRRMGYKRVIHSVPSAVHHIHAGDMIALGGRGWQVIDGYGHSPEHASLYNAEDNILIAGDMVLPFITPNISFFPGHAPGSDPVAEYMSTLDRIAVAVPNDALVLPSHGKPFQGYLHDRIAAIKDHHIKRLDKLHDVLATGGSLSAYDAMQGLFAHRELKQGDIFFALGETLAHLVYSHKRGKVIETMEKGRILYRMAD
ncbi:MAG TPA: MBL fold metallo-hydrolase [Alphaproteobacteria bacterium]|nr:MBL fold metallo-hydrolase [Alphaproteobacteria bacterium]